MANTVEYIYELIDRYSKPLKQVTQATSRFRMQVNKTCEAMDKLGSKFERLPVNMRNFKRTIGSPVFQNQIRMLKTETKDIAQNIDKMGRASAKFSIQSKGLRAGKTVPAGGGVGGGLAGRFGGAAGAITGLGAAIGGAAIAGGMFSFAKAASDMQDAMADVARVTGLAGPDLKRMQDRLQALGRATGRSAIGLAAIAYEGGKLGIANDQMEMFVGTVMKTAVAFDMADQEAGRAIGSIRAKLGLSVQSVDNLLQRVNYLADTTSASGASMINIIERTSGTFGSLDIPPQVIAGWAGFADQIETTSELAASGLNQMMIRLIQMPGMLEKMLKDPKSSVVDFLTKLKGMDKLKRSAAIIKMFGLETSRFVLKAVDKVDLLKTTMEKAADTKALGSMNREFENYLKRSSTAAKRVSQTFADIKRSIGEVFLATFDKYVPSLLKAQKAILMFVKAHPGLVRIGMVFGAIAVAIAAVIVPFGMLLAMAGAALPLFTAIGAAELAILWPITAVVAAFAVLSAIFAAMWYKSGAFRQSLSNLVDAFSPLVELVKPAVVWIGEKLGMSFQSTGADIKFWGDTIAVVINGVASVIRGLIELLIGLGQYWKQTFVVDLEAAMSGLKKLDSFVSGVGGKIEGFFNSIGFGPRSESVGKGVAAEKAGARQDNKIEFSGSIGVSASGGSQVDHARIGLNTGSNQAYDLRTAH